jgi:PqqD family protein of HPr-rel-A system
LLRPVSTRAYRVNPVVKLHWATWNDQYVVFDETSGQTHLIEAANALVLDLLVNDTLSFDALHKELATLSAPLQGANLSDWLISVVTEFETSGLLEEIRQ